MTRSRAICFVSIAAFAGIRPSEVQGVSGQRGGIYWEDINCERRHIFVRKGKNGKSRLVRFQPKPERGLSAEVCDLVWGALAAWIEPHREADPWGDPLRATPEMLEAGHPVCPRKTQPRLSRWLRKEGLIDQWGQDGPRKSWFSRMWALDVDPGKLCSMNDNSLPVFFKHYGVPEDEHAGREWFGIRPSSGPASNVVNFNQSAA